MSAPRADEPAVLAARLHGAPAIAPGRATRVGFILLLAGSAAMSFYDLGGGARFEPIDCWVAQTAREMLAAGDWLVPRFSGEVRMQKSPGPYWAVMLTSLPRGGVVDEVSARIPSAIAAVVLVATVFWLTRRIAGDRAAIFGGMAAASSALVLWWSHRGASDLGLATCTTLALAAVWIGAECEPAGRKRAALLLLGYFAAGVGMLYKMPMPVVAVGLPAVAYVVLLRRWSLLASGWHLVGLLLFLLPWLPWVVGVSLVEGAALGKWKVEFLDRFTGDLPNVEGQKSWKFLLTYLGPTVLYTLPFTLSLPSAFGRALRSPAGVQRRGMWFMVIWFGSLFAFFTASAGKEWRYFLPALPPLFVLLGVELAALFDAARVGAVRRDRVVAVAVSALLPVGLLGAGSGALWLWWQRRGCRELEGLYSWADVWAVYAIAAAILTIGLVAAVWLYARRREVLSFGTIVVTMCGMWLWAWPQIMPLLVSQRPFIDFAQQLRRRVPSEYLPLIRHVGTQDSRIIWYGDFRFPRLIDQLRLLEEQGYRRSLEYEMRRYGEEIVAALGGAEPALFLTDFKSYLRLVNAAPMELARRAQAVPPLHLWLQSRYGAEDRHFVLFGNRPPPFPEPKLAVSPEVRARLAQKGRMTEWPTRGATTQRTLEPRSGG